MGRPITDWEQIIGHKNVCRFIRNSLNKNTVRDVILFYGNSGLGKTSIAKLMACHLIAQNNESLLKRCIQEVILENKSNELIKVIGMTDVGEKEDEIAKVKQELSLGFSTVGRKVVIIDEVQGMTKKAQDGLLTELEALQDGVYVFMCTNDVTRLQDALFSRCRSRFQLHNLNRMEINQLVRRQVEYKRLRFSMSLDTVVTLISYYASYQARDAVNLIDNFEDGSVVTNDDLSVFVNADASLVVIQLINYLYGSLTLGLDYISTMEIDTVFQDTISECLKVALGGDSKLLTKQEQGKLQTIIKGNDINVLLHFTVDILSYQKINTKQIMSAFIKNHMSMRNQVVPTSVDAQQVVSEDISTIEQSFEQSTGQIKPLAQEADMKVMSIDDILARADDILKGE